MQVRENLDNVLDFVKNLGVGRRPLNDPYFENSHKHCKVFERKGVTVEDDEALCHEMMKEFPCNACSATFQNLLDYELHYHDCHHYVCAECKKWRPTARLLDIHVQETHDNFFKVLAKRQPEYQCFVSECDLKFKDAVERRLHCRTIHEFPKNYRYDDLAHAKSSNKDCEKNETMETEDSEPLRKASSQIKFGNNNKQKTFKKVKQDVKAKESTDEHTTDMESKISASSVTTFIPRQVQQKINPISEKNEINLMDLENSLPKIE